MHLIVLFLFIGMVSCGKSTPDLNNQGSNSTSYNDPSQYGTPFSGVPDARDAVIYQVNIRCFSTTHNFQGVISRLDSIKSLGINVIYLMPIYPVGTLNSVNSPYCVKDYKAVNSEFGTLDNLRTLIDGAHNRGMAVILDWVANHTSWDNAWITSNPSWYVQNSSGVIQSPSGWSDVAQLNFQNYNMRAAMINAMKYWVFTANCDGFRCDYADGPPTDFWTQAIDTLRNIKTHKLVMMAESDNSSLFSSGFDLTFGFNYYGQLKSIFSATQSVAKLDNINTQEYSNAGDNNRVVRYLTNHDVNNSDGTPLSLFGGSQGSMAAFVAVAYSRCVPMIYNGQEVGYPKQLIFPFTNQAIDWTLNPSMVAEYKKIISFRNNSAALRRGTIVSYSNTDVSAFIRQSGSENVLVISNLRNAASTYTLPSGISNTVWTDAFSGTSVTLSTSVTLQPYSYLVLKQ